MTAPSFWWLVVFLVSYELGKALAYRLGKWVDRRLTRERGAE